MNVLPSIRAPQGIGCPCMFSFSKLEQEVSLYAHCQVTHPLPSKHNVPFTLQTCSGQLCKCALGVHRPQCSVSIGGRPALQRRATQPRCTHSIVQEPVLHTFGFAIWRTAECLHNQTQSPPQSPTFSIPHSELSILHLLQFRASPFTFAFNLWLYIPACVY